MRPNFIDSANSWVSFGWIMYFLIPLGCIFLSQHRVAASSCASLVSRIHDLIKITFLFIKILKLLVSSCRLDTWYSSDGSNNCNRGTPHASLTTATAMRLWVPQPRCFFSTTAHILRIFYSRKSLFYLCWSSNCNYVIATYFFF